jgi:sn-glycerol 3-phosphate transport system permease protein
MIERTPLFDAFTYAIMFVALLFVLGPFWVIFSAATQNLRDVNLSPIPFMPGTELFNNVAAAWERAHLGRAMWNSLVMSVFVVIGKITISAISAYAIVFFRSWWKHVFFWMVFITLMLPLEVRVIPTYNVAADALQPIKWLVNLITGIQITTEWNLLNSQTGLVLPIIATATGTFLYRQFYMTLPDELAEAARMDGAGAIRFFIDFLLPLSRTNMLSLTTIMFVYAWNQYLWPLLMTTEPEHKTAMVAMLALVPDRLSTPEWNVTLAGALIIMLPPLVVVAVLQRWFVRGLVSTEK